MVTLHSGLRISKNEPKIKMNQGIKKLLSSFEKNDLSLHQIFFPLYLKEQYGF